MAISNEAIDGECKKCGARMKQGAMTKHVQKCFEATAGKPAVILLVSSPYLKPYWMHVALKADAKLPDLDGLLREEWLECCGHMSQFTVGGKNFIVGEPQEEDEYEMDTAPASLLQNGGKPVPYEYDFGTATELTVKVIGTCAIAMKGKVAMLSRNIAPKALCDVCGGPAKFIEAEGAADGKAYCGKCEKKCKEKDYLLPIVNSPRTGQCGYAG